MKKKKKHKEREGGEEEEKRQNLNKIKTLGLFIVKKPYMSIDDGLYLYLVILR
jgi:hypothetical protein